VRWSIDDEGNNVTIGWPICGQKIRVNGESRIVTQLSTHYIISITPIPIVKEMQVGDSWESA